MADGTGDGDAQQPRGWFGFGGVRARAAAARRGPGVMRAAAFAARQGKGRGQPGGQTAHRQPLRRKCGAGHAGPPTRTGHDMHAGAAWATQYPVGRSRVWAARPQTMPHHPWGQACVRLQRRGAVGAALGARADRNPSLWGVRGCVGGVAASEASAGGEGCARCVRRACQVSPVGRALRRAGCRCPTNGWQGRARDPTGASRTVLNAHRGVVQGVAYSQLRDRSQSREQTTLSLVPILVMLPLCVTDMASSMSDQRRGRSEAQPLKYVPGCARDVETRSQRAVVGCTCRGGR